jgi:CelD/BcsL family acetyltransferase involved in cellulose biosynthesis
VLPGVVKEPYRGARRAPRIRPRFAREIQAAAPPRGRRPPAAALTPSRVRPRGGRSATELIDSVGGLRSLAEEWDELAQAACNPATSPGWILSWLRHAAGGDIAPRVIAVRDRGELVGLVPLYVSHGRRGVTEYRLMASDFGVCLDPLALPGREWDVAGELARVLAGCDPHPDIVAFGPMCVASHWPAALKASWPGRMPALVRHHDVQGAPVIVLRESSFESWFASLSSKMRNNLRRSERQFERAGGSSRWSTAETLRTDAEAFARLHAARWRRRGWSRLLDLGSRLPDWIEDVGRDLIAQGRFRMCVLEVDGSPICVDFHLMAGEELSTVNVGWDERYAHLAPPRIAALRLVEGACRWGCRRLRLGRGEHEHKLCLANGNDPVGCTMVMPSSPRLPHAYVSALPVLVHEHAREIAARAVPERAGGGSRPQARRSRRWRRY